MALPPGVSEDMSKYKNGNDIHFDYSSLDNSQIVPNSNSAKKKKKKKKSKAKNKIPPGMEATINDAESDYPASRIIKQAPNGDVIVESLDEPHTVDDEGPLFSVWNNSTYEEQRDLKRFWESLDEEQKLKLVKIDKKSILSMFRNERTGAHGGHIGSSHSFHGSSGSNGQMHNQGLLSDTCSCYFCGRNSNLIEEELENIYDNHFDDIMEFIQVIRDINDVNALPGLLFGSLNALEEELKLYHNRQDFKDQHIKHRYEHSPCIEHSGEYDGGYKEEVLSGSDDANVEGDIIDHAHEDSLDEHHEKDRDVSKDEASFSLHSDESGEKAYNSIATHIPHNDDITEQKHARRELDPKLFEALENLNLSKMPNSANDSQLSEILEKTGMLRTLLKDLQNADKAEFEKGLVFLQSMSKVLSSNDIHDYNSRERMNEQISHGIARFAEDLLKNDGNSFINIMESLSDAKGDEEHRFDSLQEFSKNGESDINMLSRQLASMNSTNLLAHEAMSDSQLKDHSQSEHSDEAFEDEDLADIDEFEENEEDIGSETESEISEEEKMQEIRRLFLIQVIKLFQQRLKDAYKEKLSQDRTKKLIEELEAEESAKKERELKKLKQKEKAKEKKRIQQLAKEEERKKKVEEQKAKEEEKRLKQEALRAEQRRKKEEARKKKDEEKQKRIEELRRKELEMQKMQESQRIKEEEAKKFKEERRKKIEEERKVKEMQERKLGEREAMKEQEKRKKEEEERIVNFKDKQQYAENKISPQSVNREPLKSDFGFQEDYTQAGSSLEIKLPQNDVSLEKAKLTSNDLLDLLIQSKLANASALGMNNFPPNSHGLYIPKTSTSDLLSSGFPGSSSNGLASGSSENLNSLSLNINNTGTGISPWGSHYETQNPLNSRPSQVSGPSGSIQGQNVNNSYKLFISPNMAAGNVENITSAGLNSFGFTESFSTDIPSSNVWSPNLSSRSNSIWNNSSNISSGPSLWSNSVIPPPVPLNGTSNHPATSENESVQRAAYRAFQFLQSSNQLEFGIAPSLKLFQATKCILGSATLTLNQFLSSCRNTNGLSSFTFDFVYDDFGTVTHIKVNNSGIMQGPPSTVSGTDPLSSSIAFPNNHNLSALYPNNMDGLTNGINNSSNTFPLTSHSTWQ